MLDYLDLCSVYVVLMTTLTVWLTIVSRPIMLRRGCVEGFARVEYAWEGGSLPLHPPRTG